MQNIIMYVAADTTLGTIRDYANAKTVAAPTLTKGVAACLHVRLFPGLNDTSQYPIDQFSRISSWKFALDNDYDSDTTVKISADNPDIHVKSVVESIDGSEFSFVEIVIPISQMNTVELNSILLKNESISTLTGELVGIDNSGNESFVLQMKGFSVRNRISSTGNPVNVPSEYLTESQTRALIRAGFDIIYSELDSDDPKDWHDAQNSSDMYYRFRIADDQRVWSSGDPESSGWSSPIKLAIGKFIGSTCVVEQLADDGKIHVTESIPVAVEFSDGSIFPCEKNSIFVENNIFKLDPAPYCIYRNKSEPDFPWIIHLAAGGGASSGGVSKVNGKTGNITLSAEDIGAVSVQDFVKTKDQIESIEKHTFSMPIQNLELTNSIKLNHQVISYYRLKDGDVISFDTIDLKKNESITAELWLYMPETVVSFSIPDVVWLEDPDFDTGDTTYTVVIRWTGSKLLANLGYNVPGAVYE